MHWSTDGCKELWVRIVSVFRGAFQCANMPDVSHDNRSIYPLPGDPSRADRKPWNVLPVFRVLCRPFFGNWLLYKLGSKMKLFVIISTFREGCSAVTRRAYSKKPQQIYEAANAVLIVMLFILSVVWEKTRFSLWMKVVEISNHRALFSKQLKILSKAFYISPVSATLLPCHSWYESVNLNQDLHIRCHVQNGAETNRWQEHNKLWYHVGHQGHQLKYNIIIKRLRLCLSATLLKTGFSLFWLVELVFGFGFRFDIRLAQVHDGR